MAKPPEPFPPEVLAAFERGKPIEAIKLLLGRRANSLAVVQPQIKQPSTAAIAQAKPPTQAPAVSAAARDGLSPGEVPRTSSAFWAWVVAALFAYLAYRLARG